MITVADAVREFGGKWQSPKSILVIHDDDSYEFCDTYGGRMICTREEFEAEAERQALETLEGFTAYAQPGFEGDPNDCAFKDSPLPVGWHGECSWGQKVNWIECMKLHGNLIARRKYHWDDREWIIDSIDPDYEFRPLKSDRERWVEAARDEGFPLWVAGLMYDKVTSGELPIPEVK